MRRATVTIPDRLEKALNSYARDLEFPPSLAAVMQAALKEYLVKVFKSEGGRELVVRAVKESSKISTDMMAKVITVSWRKPSV